MTMQRKQDSVSICMCSLVAYCVAPHTRAPPLVYLSSTQSLNRVYLSPATVYCGGASAYTLVTLQRSLAQSACCGRVTTLLTRAGLLR